jgi:aryl-alcohol dehydrogenase-like predicted oxidoreductase
VLASKCFFPMSDDPNDRGLSRKHVHESIDGSLRRLGTDYLDLYQCHRFDPETPVLETAVAMDDLIRRGKVLYWGVSQWPAERITEVVELCRRERLHAPISNQPLYNLFERGIEADVIPASLRAGLGQIVYSPLAQGVLTGKYRPEAPPPPGSRGSDAQSNQFLGRYTTPVRLQQAAAFASYARSRGASPAGMALAFCLRNPGVTSVVVGASSGAQLRENITGAAQSFADDVWRQVEQLFPV